MEFKFPSFSSIISIAFFLWMSHSMYTMYKIYMPRPCDPSKSNCLDASFKEFDTFLAFFCTSTSEHLTISKMTIQWRDENFSLKDPKNINLKIDLPESVLNNGSLYFHFLFSKMKHASEITLEFLRSKLTSYTSGRLTKHIPKQAEAYNLLGERKKSDKMKFIGKPITHWKPKIILNAISEPLSLDISQISVEIVPFLKLNQKKEYLPISYMSETKSRVRDLWPVNKTNPTMPLEVAYEPITFGKFRFMLVIEGSLKTMYELGFSDTDTDDIKTIFFDTSIYLLLLTVFVTSCHVLFDFLAFKNDIQFWRNRKSMEGLSRSTLLWRCTSQFIITLYLYDQETSLLVLIPSAIGALIEFWKVKKALKITLRGLKIEIKAKSDAEEATDEYDTKFMKYLSRYVLYPLVVGGAIYSLLYTQHKSWYSWTIQSAANGVYAFGFLFMLPQLFINYKLKSVAHLPWKAFMYKAFNTFIDDLFAFLLTSLPTAHRVAAFRDDVVFIIYLYQRYLYPVDNARVNEFGESSEAEKKTN